MTTVVAAMPATAALAPPAIPPSTMDKTFTSITPSTSATPVRNASTKTSSHSPPTLHEASLRRTTSDGNGKRSSPPGGSSRSVNIPKVIVKKEPTSPDLPTGRHRPTRLNLASSNMSNGPVTAAGRPSAPLTSQQSAGLAIHDIGVACLSPGFNTQDPTMREQMERAMNIREQQRRLIEDRQKGKTGGAGPPTTEAPSAPPADNIFNRPTKAPMTSRRKGPPPGLSIAAPAPEQFANERVIQSAPLHASFPRHHNHPGLSRLGGGPVPSNPSHIHHVQAIQTQNRLPPIADVFPEVSERTAGLPSSRGHNQHYESPGRNHPPLPSPGHPPHTAQFPPSGHGHLASLASRPREHKSAEEALKELTGGREDLLPRLVHYGGHQPPTPPSPKAVGLGLAPQSHGDLHRSGSSRRRDRDEYERDNGGSPGQGPVRTRSKHGHETRSGYTSSESRGAFGGERDSPATVERKKEEFMGLVSRAWDLWHS